MVCYKIELYPMSKVLQHCHFQQLRSKVKSVTNIIACAGKQAWWHLLLSALCSNCRQAYCCHPGSEEPEKDGCWWSLRLELCNSAINIQYTTKKVFNIGSVQSQQSCGNYKSSLINDA